MPNQSSVGFDSSATEKGTITFPMVTNADAVATVAIAAAAPASALKSGSGRLVSVLVTATGTAALTFTDSTTGTGTPTIIGIIPASAAVTGIPFVFKLPFKLGLWCASGTGSPAVTVGYC